ncbi:hypothetical protein WIS52_14275 [Pseudonocardia nematodicida]|uniref:Uncharacterized protein n=1 Tax=Pseudonocardia nematodicida TaxID=1206997 RepID=A0ABV1KCP7_9PSEU
MFAPGSGAVTTAVAVALLLVVLLAVPAGRRGLRAVFAAVGRWPAHIRSELRGQAPLGAGDARTGAAPDTTTPDTTTPDTTTPEMTRPEMTTPEIPAVRDEPLPPTRGMPQVSRSGR